MGLMQHILSIAHSGVRAGQFSVAVASNNIANVNTPGYAREVLPLSADIAGLGVRVSDPVAVRDALLMRSLSGAQGRLGYYTQSEATLGAVEPAINELDGDGLGTRLRAFGAALSAASANPSGSIERQQVMEAAETLAATFSATRSQIEGARDNSVSEAQALSAEATVLAATIADLNGKIRSAPGPESNELISQREQKIRELSSIMGVRAIARGDGTVQIQTAGGRPLVESTFPATVKIELGPPPAQEPRVVFEKANGDTLEAMGDVGGRLGGVIDANKDVLTPAIETLDEMAYHFAEAFNATHRGGYDLNGATGFDFFAPMASADGAAANLKLSLDVSGFPDHIAAADDQAGVPGGNKNLLALADLIDQQGVLPSGESVVGAFDGVINSVGRGIRSARSGAALESGSVDQFQNLLDSVQGVNLDEELMRVTQANVALEASNAVIQSVQEMTQTVLNMVR